MVKKYSARNWTLLFLLLLFPPITLAECIPCSQNAAFIQNQAVAISEAGEASQEISITTTNSNVINSAGISRLKELQEKLWEKRAEIKQKTTSQHTTLQARLAEHKVTRIKNLFQHLKYRYDNSLNHLEKIIEKIESRIQKIENQQPQNDLSNPKIRLDELKIKINEAKDALLAAEKSLDDILASDNPQADIIPIHDLVKEINLMLKEIHAELIEIVVGLKII